MTRMSSRHITGSMFYNLMPCSRRVDMRVNSNKRHVIRNSYQRFSASSFVAVSAHKSDNYQQNATILPPPDKDRKRPGTAGRKFKYEWLLSPSETVNGLLRSGAVFALSPKAEVMF